MTVALLGTASIRAGDVARPDPIAAQPHVELAPDVHSPFLYRHGSLGRTGREGRIELQAIAIEAGSLFRTPKRSTAFLGSYSKALERETERSVDKDPSLQWSVSVDEDGTPIPRVQRMAEKIFDGAHERLLTRVLENLISEARPLKAARDYIDGVELDIVKGGGVDFRAGETGRERKPVSASFGLVVAESPRVEIRTTLAGLKTRVEIPLGSTGIRATLSRKLTHSISGKLGAGYEDSGEDRWLSMGLEIKF